MDFRRFEICSFDCYGTLIDWETGIIDALRPILYSNGIKESDEKILELFAETESAIQSGDYLLYKEILSLTLMSLGGKLGFKPSDQEKYDFSQSIKNWVPFSDTIDALKKIRSRFKLAIISNIDDDLFAYSAEKLQIEFEHVFTAQQSGSYKPSKKNFIEAIKRFGIKKENILHIAQSLYHDICPANDLGITTVWVNRRSNRPGFGATPPAEAEPDMTVIDLKELSERMEIY